MEHVIFSILTSVIGLGVGAVSVIIYNNVRVSSASNKVEEILEKAKKDSEKIKRESKKENLSAKQKDDNRLKILYNISTKVGYL